jgi:hypothetical protein
MSDRSTILLRQLKPIMASISEAVLLQFDSSGHQAREAFRAWQPHYLFPPRDPQHEFCLQTACIQFVRLYCMRICEEYELLPPLPADEVESRTWLASSMEIMLYILNNPDYGASAGIAHCFDWFAPGEQNMLQLYCLLKQHNLKALFGDMLGKVYNEGFIEQHNRSEKGQFYTPPHIVDYMLTTLEIPTFHDNSDTRDYDYTKYRTYLYKTVADLSCGSGSFLLSAAARKRAILQQFVAANEINRDDALSILTSTIVGFDLNPFACHLSTINLLIQCLPFLLHRCRDTGGKNTEHEPLHSPLRFSIHCADALDPHSIEQAGLGQHTFDYLVGNPPYVSAHESSSNLLYRNKISSSGHYRLLSQKWDLFVPFFERNLQLLQAGTGRLGLIVSSGIETEGYAERLRHTLCERYSLQQIDFFPGLRVFPHTGIESTMVFVENLPPGNTHTVTRRRHLRTNLAAFETLPPARQLAGTEQVFRWRYLPTLGNNMANGSIPLCALAYIGTGIDGQRHKRFSLQDVFLLPANENERPEGYPDDGVLGDDVDNYYLRRKRYVAYEQYRTRMRGPRHAALFRTPAKLLLGETSGGYYDTDRLFANHSVQVAVPWHALEQPLYPSLCRC